MRRRAPAWSPASAGGEAGAAAAQEVGGGRVFNIADDAPVTAVELHQLNGLPIPADSYERTDPDPWFCITSTERIRRELGFRPLHPSVWSAQDAGAL